MYELDDTIVAVSSPTSEKRAILRITGPNTIKVLKQIFSPPIPQDKAGLFAGSIAVGSELKIDAKLYLFLAPRSYTGETLAEIHIDTNASVTEALMGRFLGKEFDLLRMAEPGEFTARSYFNGKIDLSQAEAVNEIITSSNKFQLAAAEELLAGRLAEKGAKIRSFIMDCLGLIEAGMDFSQEDIEFISRDDAVKRLAEIKFRLEQLLSDSISYESVVDLPAVGLAGAPNAGKSSLLNKLLGQPRSIVSRQHKTTRDVLTGMLKLAHCKCVLFDCAGLVPEPNNILDELAQQAAVEALCRASVVVFCVDISKRFPLTKLGTVPNLIDLTTPKSLITVATKSDLLSQEQLAGRLAQLNKLLGTDVLVTSARTSYGVGKLRQTIDKRIVESTIEPTKGKNSPILPFSETADKGVALTVRHRQAVIEAIENINDSVNELKAGNDEVAAMVLRAAYCGLSNIEQQHIDEQILENIFNRFCIGK